ncbi:putative glucose-induced degradation protein 8 -like protein isoform X1 [Capsicum annuum]|uniref:COP1-interacting protein 7 n=1 Tax=Capsicum annuum TaxID=4072 RepID=UPI0007BF9157|nr:COP1-interacting protein 7 [Capsicum annuum]KAF3653637.1 putative glucose-induced degradation protein 8 -like protein isoform X1 [Capsicum annuum]KAF3658477.1 putative glucose-induced degradation protein 8 -like protein isoform X1 [Capsicum annuum]
MDSRTLLDYALFQLTPTRTRCDLVVFSGSKSEKLASGLVEPFISHLKFAKDQIPKGGYSITLKPPSTHAYWFTKATFLRFVRFVSTPEILERFMRLEREILQIESSIQSNECSNGNSEEGSSPASESTRKSNDSFKAKSEVEEANNAAPKENSKIHLQRHLDTRKALLRKEQAMAYARATVAGFEIDQLDDLIQFANSFGAIRLRDACLDFKELYKQKHTDGQWMDEVAAMKACTPVDLSYLGNQSVILAYDNNGSLDSSDSKESTNSNGVKDENHPASDPSMSAKAQMQMPWQNQIPPYMYNFHGPAQQMPFAGMHPLQYYPAHMQWPQNVNGSVRDSHKRSKKKEKSSLKEHDSSEDDEQTESSASDSGTDSDEVRKHEKKHSSRENSRAKKHKKKSSKTVVIRNINYITSKRKNEENDGSSYDSSSAEEDSIKEQVDDAVAILEKRRNSKGSRNKNRGHQDLDVENESNGYSNTDPNEGVSPKLSEKAKGNAPWDAFQNILMSREESNIKGASDQLPLNFQDEGYGIKNSGEKVRRDHLTTDDSLLMSKSYEENDTKVSMVEFANGEDRRPNLKKGVSEDVHLLFSHTEPSGGNTLGTPSDFGSESSAIRNSNGEDWFVVNHSGSSETQESRRLIFDNDSGMSIQKSSSQVESERAPIDDSFMVQSRPSFDDHYGSQWKTDICMDADMFASANAENGDPAASKTKLSTSGASQPDDLCVVLARGPSLDPVDASWQPELDFQIEASYTQVDKKPSVVETNSPTEEKVPVKGKSASKKYGLSKTGKDARSKVSPGALSRSRIDALAKSKKMSPPNKLTTQKSKLDREEEMRKRMEELVIERQKRIAERSAAKGSSPAATKKGTAGSKTASPKISPSSKVHTFPVQVRH